ncbi:MAG: helix-turn-helix transcriptional regulator [Clostridiales bacterium]|nr:helix-turn-helix transcriptional regulator [Clostridiales bacterium]
MKLSDALAERIEELLQEHKITQYKLSQMSGISQSTICDIRLKRYKTVNLMTIYELADGLNIGLDEFFDSPLFKRENIE